VRQACAKAAVPRPQVGESVTIFSILILDIGGSGKEIFILLKKSGISAAGGMESRIT
jgi:hypothetical protein